MTVGAGIVIVGASLAGFRTAEELRRCGYEGRVRLVGEEPGLPYDRPPLSKGFLAGGTPEEQLALTSRQRLDELGIEFAAGLRATSVDRDRRLLTCDDGVDLAFENLVVTTGSHARRPAWARGVDGVHVLRTQADSAGLSQAATTAEHVVIVGGGYIGTEVAATLRQRGCRVTLLIDGPIVLPSFGPLVGQRFTRHFRDRGVDVRTGSAVIDAIARPDGVDLLCSDGSRLRADVVLAALGSAPTTGWISELADRDSGALPADPSGRVSDVVWAAGDVTGGGHWYAAVRQARLVARSLTGVADRTTQRLVDEVPYAWTDQFETKVQTLGRWRPGQKFDLVPGHDLESLTFTGVYSSGGVMTAAVMADRPRDLAKVRSLLTSPTSLDDAVVELSLLASA